MLITLARKPLAGSVANNVLAHGCGALNIDQCRIATSDDFSGVQGFASMKLNAQRRGESDEDWKARVKGGPEQQAALAKLKSLGRWPANVLVTPTAAEGMDAQSGTTQGVVRKPTGKPIYPTEGAAVVWNQNSVADKTERGFADTGGASRYFKQIG